VAGLYAGPSWPAYHRDTVPWFIARYDARGRRAWIRRFPSLDWTNQPGSLAVSQRGEIFLVGWSFPRGYQPHPIGDGRQDAFLTRLSDDGERRWTVRYDGRALGEPSARQVSFADLALGPAGALYVVGSIGTYSDGVPSSSPIDALVARFSVRGSLRWFRAVGTRREGWDSASSGAVDDRGLLWVAGDDATRDRGALLLRAFAPTGQQVADMGALSTYSAGSMVRAAAGDAMYAAVGDGPWARVLRLMPA
jgi:hypothetical protein